MRLFDVCYRLCNSYRARWLYFSVMNATHTSTCCLFFFSDIVLTKAGNPAKQNCLTKPPFKTSCQWKPTAAFPSGQCVSLLATTSQTSSAEDQNIVSTIDVEAVNCDARNRAGKPAKQNCLTKEPYSSNCQWKETSQFPSGQCVKLAIVAANQFGKSSDDTASESITGEPSGTEDNTMVILAFAILLVAVVVGPALVIVAFKRNQLHNKHPGTGSFFGTLSETSSGAGSKFSLAPSITSTNSSGTQLSRAPSISVREASGVDIEWDDSLALDAHAIAGKRQPQANVATVSKPSSGRSTMLSQQATNSLSV